MTTAGKVLLAVSSVLAMSVMMSATVGCQGDPKAEEPPVEIMPDDMIDDFEDGDDSILSRGGRAGFWYTYHEPTNPNGVIEPMDGAAVAGKAGTLTVRASNWLQYVGFGFQFKKALTAVNPEGYDLSQFKGIAFKVRGTGRMSMGIAMPEVLPPSEGGVCVESSPPMNCHDVHKALFSVTGSLRQVKIPFTNLHQEGWGVPATFNRTSAIAFQLDSVDSGPFDIEIDEVGFYR
jgi:hypothetical protein